MAGNVLGEPCERLYVEGLPGDISRREVAHIFRPFGGFQVCAASERNFAAQLITNGDVVSSFSPFTV